MFLQPILSQKEFKFNFLKILGNILVQTLQYLKKKANENAKTGPNLNFCSMKIAHCATYVEWTLISSLDMHYIYVTKFLICHAFDYS